MNETLKAESELAPAGTASPGHDTARLLAGLEASFHQRRAQIWGFLATLPVSSPCPHHPGHERPRDDRESWAERRVIFGPCARCESFRQEQKEIQRLEAMGIPRNLCDATLDNWKCLPDDPLAAEHLAAVRDFARKRRGFLVLAGDLGRGKSHLAAAVLRTFRRGWMVKQSELLRQLRATYRDAAALDPVRKAQQTDCLVLDEMGLSPGGADELCLLHDVLDFRHGAGQPTILTGNIGYEEMCAVMGPRMKDRLRESAYKILTFGGHSVRRQAKEKYFGE